MSAILFDTNLLVLLIAGTIKPALVGTHRRLRAFSGEDYHNLSAIAARYADHVSTPNILTEASNLLGSSDQEMFPGAGVALANYCASLREIYVPSETIMSDSVYLRFGLADASIIDVALRHRIDVMTAEYALHGILVQSGGTSVNLRHLSQYRE